MTILRQKVAVLMPVYNEAKYLDGILDALKTEGYPVLVVDDGSHDGSAEIARRAGAEVISLAVNSGKGSALRAGFRRLAESDFDWVLILDSDGQHLPGEIPRFVEAAATGRYDVLNGSRLGNPKGMPFIRLWTNRFMSWVVSQVAGQKIEDTQCGYKMLSMRFLKSVSLEVGRFEIEDELLLSAAMSGFRIGSVPVTCVYGDEKSRVDPVKDTIRFMVFIFKWMKKKRLSAAAKSLAALCLCAAAAAGCGTHRVESIKELDAQVHQLYNAAKYPEAYQTSLKVLKLSEKEFGPEDRRVSVPLNNAAGLARKAGKPEESKPYYERLIRIMERELGPDNRQLEPALHDLASVLVAEGKLEEAAVLERRVLDIKEKNLKPDHPGLGGTLNNLGYIYMMQGKFAEAEPLILRAAEITEAQLGGGHEKTTIVLGHLAQVYRLQKKNADAARILRRLLEAKEKQNGPDDPEVGRFLNNLALVLKEDGKIEEAIPLQERAIAIFQKDSGNYAEDLATALENYSLTIKQRDAASAKKSGDAQ